MSASYPGPALHGSTPASRRIAGAERSVALLCCLALSACRITGSAPNDASLAGDQPAVIVNPTPQSHAELERVVSDMLFGAEVTLSEDALTESSVLVVERERIRSLENPPLSGRDLGRPERFRLLTTGTECVLIHESNHARYELPQTDCIPEEMNVRPD